MFRIFFLAALAAISCAACTTTSPTQQADVACPKVPLTPIQRSQLDLYINDALHGEDQHERNNGIRALELIPASEGVAVLMQAAREDPDMGNRILALSVMTHLATQGCEAAAIRETFRQISEDQTSNVAHVARIAYTDLLKTSPLD